MTDWRRELPSIDRLLQAEDARPLLDHYPRAHVTEALRGALDAVRSGSNGEASTDRLLANAQAELEARFQSSLQPVINATGVILHTNLGRAPLSQAARQAMEAVAAGYSSLEFDVAAGARGSRHEHLTPVLRRLTGAEAALIVNNNASAVMLALAALAAGREVIISRGQLVEIGGGFRIPDVLLQSGAHLVEVGTTNRTYLEDYAAAITEATAVLLRVHTSNFKVTGFVHAATIEELVSLARQHQGGLTTERGNPLVVPPLAAGPARLEVADDLGSGSLLPTETYGLEHEPMVQESVAAGADVVCFSGDKLLGGPQAGIIVGKADVIAKLRRHPLTRAVRPDKATLAALHATLLHYDRGEAQREIPVWLMIATPTLDLERRGRHILAALGSPSGLGVVESRATIGGGSLPEETLPSRAISVRVADQAPQAIAARLRQ
ncbi:MAG TPA: L-seryl-tRNA(Sec) selenium transferase, partial [Chloroflexota bacterium]